MKILVSGANGFIGKHLCQALQRNNFEVLKVHKDTGEEVLISYIKEADYIVHLAGVNRPENVEEYYQGNFEYSKYIVDLAKSCGREIPIIMSSSIQVGLDNDYAKSKKMAEDYLLSSGLPVYIYRLGNVFGKWAKPNYNSAFATFSYNIAHEQDIFIRDDNYIVHFNYVNDVINEFIQLIKQSSLKGSKDILFIKPMYDCSLAKLASLLKYFKKEVESVRHIPLLHDDFELKLFISFLDYLTDKSYSLNYVEDERGSFEELYKSNKFGQISLNVANPNISKGGHYHTFKDEIFYTVKGHCKIIQQSIVDGGKIINDIIDDHPELIHIHPNYIHWISNIGSENSYTLMWISKIYDPNDPDTFKV